ncbi:FimB/Mfa2 family fimbrial subunit [Desertivirga arenae]|uniref:FimB/Mfa2 family fimbrial subunit n=1 Tax=Desertivirga arenae TaxID=2810309 RepID=UPI001A95A322|nr:FimB/Mfa2 family fimbrial subunit [Pedobacter sp. SYSU D00823]
MKKNLPLLSLALVLVLFACKKSSKTEIQPEEKLYPVTFKASDFEQTSKGISNTSAVDSAKNVFKKLTYAVFNSSGTLLRTISQEVNTSPNFGTILDSLPVGNYTAIFMASTGELPYSISQLSSTNVYNNNNDVFANKTMFTINGPLVNQSVTLNRIVGKLTIVLKDVIPSNVTKLVVEYMDGSYYYPGREDNYGLGQKTYNYDITSLDRASKNYTVTNFVLPNTSSTKINIRAYTSTNTLVVDKTISNVALTRNKETVVTGTLFNSVNHEGGFTVLADQTWDSSKTVVEF